MDPNEALSTLRRAIRDFRLAEDASDADVYLMLEHAATMAEHFEALDGWLRKGGVLPLSWQVNA